MILPQKATSIKIRETFDGQILNHLALRDADGKYFLNGNLRISASGTYHFEGILKSIIQIQNIISIIHLKKMRTEFDLLDESK